jgi:hypothetical protein
MEWAISGLKGLKTPIYDGKGRKTEEHLFQTLNAYPVSSTYWEYDFNGPRYLTTLANVYRSRHYYDLNVNEWKQYFISRVGYTYDESALTNRSSVAQHDPAFDTGLTARGNLTTIRELLGTESRTIKTRMEYDILGNVVKTIDAAGYVLSSAKHKQDRDLASILANSV